MIEYIGFYKASTIIICMGNKITLFSPEHFYMFNTLAVPQLTGYLIKKKIPVDSRVLDNEFYDNVMRKEVLFGGISELKNLKDKKFIVDSFKTSKLDLMFGLKGDEEVFVEGIIKKKEKIVKRFLKSYKTLKKKYLDLSKRRFLLCLGQLQAGLDLAFCKYLPTNFGVLSGMKTERGYTSSEKIYQETEDRESNFFINYYKKEIVPSIDKDTEIFGISVTHEAQLIPAFTLARVLRENFPDKFIVIGGSTISSLRNGFDEKNKLWEFFDAIAMGYGEEILEKLYYQFEKGAKNLEEIPGLIWKDKNKVKFSEADSDFKMDDIETPVFYDKRNKPILTIMTSRGCDWAGCKFCHYPVIYSDVADCYFIRPMKNVLRDFKRLKENYNPKYFHICDSDVSVQRVKDISEFFLRNNFRSEIYAFVRGEKKYTDLEFCKKARKAGFFAFHWGFETASQELLDKMNKGIKIEYAQKIIDNLNDVGIMANLFLVAATPEELPKDREMTIEFLKKNKNKLGEIAISKFYLDRGCLYEVNSKDYGIVTEWDKAEDMDTDLPFRYDRKKNKTAVNPDKSEKVVDMMYKKIGIPKSYGERFMYQMLEYFNKETFLEKAKLYWPFLFSRFF